jgi:cytochrome c oxidase assembly factor CtaG
VEVSAVVLAGGAYALTAKRNRPSRLQVAAFAAALALVLAVSVTPLATLALHYLLSAHLLQNVALAEWAPALAVAGLAPATAARIAALPGLRALLHPVAALPLWLAAYGAWHLPPVYDAALRNALLLHLEHGTYFAAGVLLWWPVFHPTPRRFSAGAKAGYLFAAFVLASPLGLLLALLPSPIYDFYEEAPRIWGLDALTDQQMAGVLMCVSEAVVFIAAFIWFFARFMAEEDAGYSPPHAER